MFKTTARRRFLCISHHLEPICKNKSVKMLTPRTFRNQYEQNAKYKYVHNNIGNNICRYKEYENNKAIKIQHNIIQHYLQF